MPNEVLRKAGDVFLFADSTVNPAAANILASTRTLVQFDPAGLVTGGMVQSNKVDLGARRAPAYAVTMCLEMPSTAPVAGVPIELYWAPSPSGTAGTANPGGIAGASGTYVGGTGGTDDGGVKQLQFIGQMACQNIASATYAYQTAFIGTFSPVHRYGTLVLHNASGYTLSATKTNNQVLFEPVIDEVQ